MKPSLRSLLATGALREVCVPGVFDPLSALIAQRAGFPALYLSGASINYSYLGRPDLGYAMLSDVESVTARITARTHAPLIVDADTGFGGALNAKNTVERLESAGASAIQLEDQRFPKRCGHLPDKDVVSTTEMVEKLKLALSGRRNRETMIIARTDAIAVSGLSEAMRRAEAYLAAGADALFIEAPSSWDQLTKIGEAFGGHTHLIANQVDGGKTPLLPVHELNAMGFDLVIVPGAPARAVMKALSDFYAGLHASGSVRDHLGQLAGFKELNDLLGLDAALDELAQLTAEETKPTNQEVSG